MDGVERSDIMVHVAVAHMGALQIPVPRSFVDLRFFLSIFLVFMVFYLSSIVYPL